MGKKNCINRRSLTWGVFLSILIIIVLEMSFCTGKKSLGQGYYFYNAHEITDFHKVIYSYTEFTNYAACDFKLKNGNSLDYEGMPVIITRVRFNDDMIIVEGIPQDSHIYRRQNKSYYWIIQNDGEDILGPFSQDDFLNLDLTNASVEQSFILEDFTLERDSFYDTYKRFLYE